MPYVGWSGVANQAQTTPGCALSVVADASAGYGEDLGGAGVVDNPPIKLPMGVRAAATITTLLFIVLELVGVANLLFFMQIQILISVFCFGIYKEVVDCSYSLDCELI